MDQETLAALAALCEAQRQLEAADRRRDELVAAARAAGATWDQVAYATRTRLSTAHSRWNRRAKVYGLPKSPAASVSTDSWPAALRSVAS